MSSVKKKFSRKNKASWRKFVNIKDVEDFLEEKRQEERLGSLSEKEDEDLFTIDTVSNEKGLSSKRKRKLNALKPPKNISILENMSKVQDPLVQRNRVKLLKSGRNLFEEVRNPDKSKRVTIAIADRKKYYEKLDKIVFSREDERSFHDIWDEDDDSDKKKFLNNDWISKELALYNLKNIGKPLVKMHGSAHHKTSRIRAFPRPHPGASYNPSLKDHQDLLKKVIEKETKIIKEEEHLKKVTTNMFSKTTEEQRDSAWLVEMCYLPEEEATATQTRNNYEKIDDDIDTSAYHSVNPPVQNKKKDKKTRRNQKEQREISLHKQKKKVEKKKISDIHKLKYISEEVLKEMELLENAKKRRKLLREKKKSEPKRISKIKYVEPEVDINMAGDIAGNLRNIKTENSLLVDRFKDFQKRNILPPNVDLGPRKRRKIKRFERNSHKETENVHNKML